MSSLLALTSQPRLLLWPTDCLPRRWPPSHCATPSPASWFCGISYLFLSAHHLGQHSKSTWLRSIRQSPVRFPGGRRAFQVGSLRALQGRQSHLTLDSRRKRSMDMRSCRTTLGNTGLFICNGTAHSLVQLISEGGHVSFPGRDENIPDAAISDCLHCTWPKSSTCLLGWRCNLAGLQVPEHTLRPENFSCVGADAGFLIWAWCAGRPVGWALWSRARAETKAALCLLPVCGLAWPGVLPALPSFSLPWELRDFFCGLWTAASQSSSPPKLLMDSCDACTAFGGLSGPGVCSRATVAALFCNSSLLMTALRDAQLSCLSS